MRVIKFFIKLIIILIFLALVAGAAFVVYDGYDLYKTTLAEQSLDERVEAAKANQSYVGTESISDDFLTAIVCVEDKNFYTHSGYNLKSTVRAFLKNLKNKTISEGGSTITQQTAKNLCFSQEKSFSRKIAELLVARDLESSYSKDDILELYVNIIYYGDGYTGVLAASEGYFGKKPYDMTFNEATLLAGLPQAPSAYALSTHSDRAYERQKEVIQAMVNDCRLTNQEAEEKLKQVY